MNEILLLITAVLCTLFVYTAWRIGKERLYTTVVVFLILIAVLGVKLVDFFGYTTNVGNVFYAAVFLSTYFLLERYGKRAGLRAIWIGAIIVAFFAVIVQAGVLLEPAETSQSVHAALVEVFGTSIRTTIASIVAFVVSQSFNIHVYMRLKQRFHDKYLWVRANITNALAQILDSSIFFFITFWSIVPPHNLNEIIIVGVIIKVLYMCAAAPLLYLNNVEEKEEDEDGSSAVVVR